MGAKLEVMCQGLKLEPWAVSERLKTLGFDGNATPRQRPASAGSQATSVVGLSYVITLDRYQDKEIVAALQEDTASLEKLSQLLNFFSGYAFAVQVVVTPDGTQDADAATAEMTPGSVAEMLPDLLDGHYVIYVRSTRNVPVTRRL